MEYRPTVAEFFEPGKEIMLYHTLDELRHMIDQGLRDPVFNRTLRTRAAARAKAEHTYEHRLRRMFEVLYA